MNSWKKMAEELMNDFMDWGCPFSREQLPEMALSYSCTPLFFANWLDGATEKTEKGFLRVLGYAWGKFLEKEAEFGLQAAESAPEMSGNNEGKQLAA